MVQATYMDEFSSMVELVKAAVVTLYDEVELEFIHDVTLYMTSQFSVGVGMTSSCFLMEYEPNDTHNENAIPRMHPTVTPCM